MSQPAFGTKRQIWYTDGTIGFYNVRVAKRVWPYARHKRHHHKHKHHHKHHG